MEILGSIIAVIIAFALIGKYQTKKRRQYLSDKYRDQIIVDKIMARTIWEGMSEEQLVDSWGRPAATEQKVYKTKVAYTFKYNQTGKNRFSSRVKIENGVVVGWTQK